ncbi:AAA family ATPase [Skermanella rosea]|uniref:AAA family ATPase n=1 Tax=Skermanella rosea TaxID=1817965 RepID=UPI001E53B861|nr:AAA family ATPase [Skermanella rosea]UEM03456.1 AAA family ATPase [Skermanella rosea]
MSGDDALSPEDVRTFLSVWRLPPAEMTPEHLAGARTAIRITVEDVPDFPDVLDLGRSRLADEHGDLPLLRIAGKVGDLFGQSGGDLVRELRATCLFLYFLENKDEDIVELRLACAHLDWWLAHPCTVSEYDLRIRIGRFLTLFALILRADTPARVAIELDLIQAIADPLNPENGAVVAKLEDAGWLPPEPAEVIDSLLLAPPKPPPSMIVLRPSLRASEAGAKKIWKDFEGYEALFGLTYLAAMPDPDEYRSDLRSAFPWCTEIIDVITGELALAARLGRPHFALPPLLLIGHSGVGKSRLARCIAGYAGVPFTQLSAGGASDSRALAGTARGWASAHPCLPLMVMRTHGVANPLLCVEEIDKAADSRHNGRISDVLLTMVEPATARQYYDECLQMPADLSAVSWVLTANHADRVDPLLRARCRVLQVPRPRPEHFGVIMAGLTEDVADEFGVAVSDLPEPPGEVVEAMRSGFAAGELNARQLAALHRRALIAATRAEKLTRN